LPIKPAAAVRPQSRDTNPNSEPVTRINDTFPHWFDGEFKKFNGQEDRLPFDQNCLVGLCARGRCCLAAARSMNGPIRR